MSSPEQRVLALTHFVENEHKQDLFKKSEVLTLLRWAARAASPRGELEIKKSWLLELENEHGSTKEEASL